MCRKNKSNTLIFFLYLISVFSITEIFAKKLNIPNPNFTYFTIAAGPASGSYFSIASSMAGLLSSPPGSPPCERGGSCGVKDLIALAHATEGSLYNVDLLKERKVDTALIQSDLMIHQKNIKTIATLYPEVLHIVVLQDSPIYKFADLKGKMISIGTRHSGTLPSVRNILNILGLAEKDYVQSYDDPGKACDFLLEGKVDVMLFFAGAPVSCIVNLAKNIPLRFINISPEEEKKIALKNKMFRPYDIEAGLYWNIGKIRSLSVMAQWVVPENTSAELVYNLAKAFWLPQNQNKLQLQFPKINFLSADQSAAFETGSLHKGALTFYEEMGFFPKKKKEIK
ncbi:MAG: TAXI family TRAP transporter solute-binding subunit [Alphaproteobacteria bacterium]|nr:TAXI family TRAP transporter solute-binding subunit [Alphaproteobacteria bacterium]